MSWEKIKLKQILKQYRIEHIVQNEIEYKQVTISKYDGVTFRGSKMGKEIGRKRQFQIDLKKFPSTLLFVRQGVQDGSIGIAPLEVDGCIATENMPMFSVEGINLEYLKFLLKSPYFYDELNKIQTTGSAQKSIHEREILEIEIPFPDIEEQEDIVQQLSSIKNNSLEIYSELTHQLTLVKKLRQQLLQDAVQGKLVEQNKKDEPASELLKKIKAEKEKLIAEKKLKKEKELPPIKAEDIPFEIPETWVWCRLGEISKHITDGEHVTPQKRTEGRMLLSAKNIRDGFITYENIDYISEEDFQKSIKRCKPERNDILIVSVGGTIGRSTILNDDEEFAIVRSVALIKPYDFRMSKYFKFVLDSPILQKEISGRSWGTAQPCLYINQIKELTIPIPPLHEQEQIVAKLEELMAFCDGLEQSIKESQGYNEKLLQQVLREALRKEPVGA